MYLDLRRRFGFRMYKPLNFRLKGHFLWEQLLVNQYFGTLKVSLGLSQDGNCELLYLGRDLHCINKF